MIIRAGLRNIKILDAIQYFLNIPKDVRFKLKNCDEDVEAAASRKD